MIAARNRRHHRGVHTCPIVHNLAVHEPEDAVAEHAESSISLGILSWIVMRDAVDFDHKSIPEKEVNSIRPKPHLLANTNTERATSKAEHRLGAALGQG